MLRAVFRVNVLQKITLVHSLCAIAASTGFLVLNSCMEQRPNDGLGPCWTRIGELLVSCENGELRSSIVLLLITMLKQADVLVLRDRFLATLQKFDIHQLLADLQATQTSDTQLVELISRFQSACGSFVADQAASAASSSFSSQPSESSAIARSLFASAKISGRVETLQSVFRHLELLEKSGDVGKGVWEHVDSFVKLAASTPVNGFVSFRFSFGFLLTKVEKTKKKCRHLVSGSLVSCFERVGGIGFLAGGGTGWLVVIVVII